MSKSSANLMEPVSTKVKAKERSMKGISSIKICLLIGMMLATVDCFQDQSIPVNATRDQTSDDRKAIQESRLLAKSTILNGEKPQILEIVAEMGDNGDESVLIMLDGSLAGTFNDTANPQCWRISMKTGTAGFSFFPFGEHQAELADILPLGSFAFKTES